MTLEELGAALRAERERRRLNLEDVASRLKIPVRMLRALEDGDTASLPHLAYAKGFIRSYALFLGMVAEEVSEAADVLGDNIVPSRPVEITMPAPAKSGHINPLRVILAILALALFCVAGLLAWQPDLAERVVSMVHGTVSEIPSPRVMPAEEIAGSGSSHGKTGTGNVSDNGTARNETAAKPDSGKSGDKDRQNASKAGIKSGAVGATGSFLAEQKQNDQSTLATRTSATEGKRSALQESPSKLSKPAKASGTAIPASGEGQQDGLHKLILTATEACSIQSRADGTQNRQFALRRGDTFALMFVNSLEVRIGNVKAVRLRYDGREVDLSEGPLTRTLQFPLVQGQ